MRVDGWDEIQDGVFQRTFESWQLNVGLVVGDERVAVVDTRATPVQGRELRTLIRRLTDRQPVVINTHAHLDHCLGNAAFEGVEIFAHPAAATAMHSAWPHWLEQIDGATPGGGEPAAGFMRPQEVAIRADVDLGGRTISVRHHGRGHTDGDLAVEVVGAGVVFAGDLVRENGAPWFGDAHPLEWSSTVSHMLLFHDGPAIWVPGHGAPMSGESVLDQARLLDKVATVLTDLWHAQAPVDVAALAVPLGGRNATLAAARGYRELEVRFGAVSPDADRPQRDAIRAAGPTTVRSEHRRS